MLMFQLFYNDKQTYYDIIESDDDHNIMHYMDDGIKREILDEIKDPNAKENENKKNESESKHDDAVMNVSVKVENSKSKDEEEDNDHAFLQRVRSRFGPFSSRAQYFDDGVLPIKYLLVLGEALLPTHADPVNDMFLSPLRAPIDVLKKFPIVRLHVGTEDPLVDDSRRFAQRLKLANPDIDVKLLEWEGLSHAYLQSPTFLLPQARYSCELSIYWLAGIMNVPIVGKESFKYDLNRAEQKTRSKFVASSKL